MRAGGSCRDRSKLQSPIFLPTGSTRLAVAAVDTVNNEAVGDQLCLTEKSRKSGADASGRNRGLDV